MKMTVPVFFYCTGLPKVGRLRLALIFVASIIYVKSAFAASSVTELQSNNQFYLPLTNFTSAFVDESASLSVQDLAREKHRYFQPITTKYIDFGGLLKGRVWLNVRVKNVSDNQGVWRLDINRQYYREVDIYIARSNGAIEQVMQSRLTDSFNDRAVRDRMLGVDIGLNKGETLDVFIAIKADASTFMPLGIGSVDAVLELHSKENTQNAIFNGALLTFVAFAFLLLGVIGWRLALTFSFYVLAGFSYIFHADGYTFVYLWPDHMIINDVMNLSLMSAMPIFGLLFCRSLFDFKKHAPAIDRFILFYVGVATFVSLSSSLLYTVPALKVFGYLVPPIGSLTQFIAGVVAVRRGLLGARPYMIGAILIMTSFIYAVVANTITGQFNHDATLDYGHFALLAEGLAFIAAIAARLVGLRLERDKAVNAELTAVQDRLRISAQLQLAREDFIQARKMADMRRTQLSSVSHDLRQPLSSLRSALTRIGGSDEDSIQQMHDAFDYLESLAQKQLNSAKPTSNDARYASNLEEFSLSVVMDNVNKMFCDEAEAAGIQFRYRPLDVDVVSDPVGLVRVISNLVANAIKHSGAKDILIAARRRKNTVRIEVWDTGKGILEHDLTRYLRSHEKGADSDGSGLGLSIVKMISDELELKFEIRSKENIGTVAFLFLSVS